MGSEFMRSSCFLWLAALRCTLVGSPASFAHWSPTYTAVHASERGGASVAALTELVPNHLLHHAVTAEAPQRARAQQLATHKPLGIVAAWLHSSMGSSLASCVRPPPYGAAAAAAAAVAAAALHALVLRDASGKLCAWRRSANAER
jgi:hypothetical protein